MSEQSRSILKAGFTAGAQATATKFSDLIDSSYSKTDDSVLIGPSGATGTSGLWYSQLTTAPTSTNSPGITGQFAVDSNGGWVCVGTDTWINITDTTKFDNRIDIEYSELYNKIINSELIPNQTYRLTDYRSTNFLNTWLIADEGATATTLPASYIDGTFQTDDGFNNMVFIIKKQADDKILVGGNFSTYNDTYARRIIRLNPDGSVDETFNTGNYFTGGFSDHVRAIEIQSDGKILVGGLFDELNGATAGYLVRLNSDGSRDTTFNLNGVGFDDYVRVIKIDGNGKILVGGEFTQYNGSAFGNIVRLNPNGTVDDSSVIGSFDDGVFDIVIDGSNSYYVGGNFTSYEGNTRNRIVKLNNDFTVDETFDTGTGFNGRVATIVLDTVNNSIIAGGQFTEYDGDLYDRIIRLGYDGVSIGEFNNGGFNGWVNRIYLQSNGKILVGGQFSTYTDSDAIITYDSNRFIRLNGQNLPTVDDDFVIGTTGFTGSDQYVNAIELDDDGNIYLGGWFLSYSNTEFSYSSNHRIIKLLGSPRATPNYDPQEIYVSDPEVLVFKATSTNTISPTCTSETHPEDILEYNPLVNKLGVSYDWYNGFEYSLGSTVSGFDLKWNGTNCYIDMPPNYPILYGHFLFIDMSFADGAYNQEAVYLSPTPSTEYPTYDYSFENSGRPMSRIRIEEEGSKIVLLDLTYDDYQNYDTSSLYVGGIREIGDSYGWVTRRRDPIRAINAPFDFRHVKYRRYEVDLSDVVDNYDTGYYGLADFFDEYFISTPLTTGKYKDFYSISPTPSPSPAPRCIEWSGAGGPDGIPFGYVGSAEGNVIGNSMHDCTIKSSFMYNTIGRDFSYNNISEYFVGNIIRDSFASNITGIYFVANVINNYFSQNKIYSTFSANQIKSDFRRNTIKAYTDNNNFNNSTLVYQDHDKDIIRASDNNNYLIYFDGSVYAPTSITA